MTLENAVAIEIVVIGTSLGGLAALETILPALDPGFSVPVAIVQHRGTLSGDRLAATLRRYTHLAVHEAHDKRPILPGSITLAPPDYHLMVERGSYALSTEAPILHARPSIDALFQSAADAYGERVAAVVLTGASRDGALGAAKIKARRGIVVVQSPETAECPVMPLAAIDSAPVDHVLPLSEIGPFLNRLDAEFAPGSL